MILSRQLMLLIYDKFQRKDFAFADMKGLLAGEILARGSLFLPFSAAARQASGRAQGGPAGLLPTRAATSDRAEALRRREAVAQARLRESAERLRQFGEASSDEPVRNLGLARHDVITEAVKQARSREKPAGSPSPGSRRRRRAGGRTSP